MLRMVRKVTAPKLKGSMTIEAAVVVPVTMAIILAIVFMGFYVNNKAAMAAVDYYSALEYAGEVDRSIVSSGSMDPDLADCLYAAYGVSAGVSGEADKYTAWSDASFFMPSVLVSRMFDKAMEQMHEDVEVSFMNGRKKLLYYKSQCEELPGLLKKEGGRE